MKTIWGKIGIRRRMVIAQKYIAGNSTMSKEDFDALMKSIKVLLTEDQFRNFCIDIKQ